MTKVNLKNLKNRGWSVGSASHFLNLTRDEEEFVDVKINLSKCLQKKRLEKKLTQIQFAKLIHSSQSRVAKMEKANESVSLDLIVRSLFALGTSKREISEAVLRSH